MAAAVGASVKTVQFTDPRIEPQPDPVYDYVIGPAQNQYYKIPSSGKTNSSLTFNNLTTLGADRAYLDTFELELSVDFIFKFKDDPDHRPVTITKDMFPQPDEWIIESFPFNKVCDNVKVNINGGAFFSQPMCYLRPKERYMNQAALAKCYENSCPYSKPICQTESGKVYNAECTRDESEWMHQPFRITQVEGAETAENPKKFLTAGMRPVCTPAVPTRLGAGMHNYMQSAEGMMGSYNNAILRLGNPIGNEGWYDNYFVCADIQNPTADRTMAHAKYMVVHLTWREPIFCSPFSSRYDATYGRPLYNITSMDLNFNMQDLGNMVRLANLHHLANGSGKGLVVESITANIITAELCYQVMTIPSNIKKPLTTIVPYRRFVPYVTDMANSTGSGTSTLDKNGGNITIRSGVYTLNEVPTAIWAYIGPSMRTLQQCLPDINGAAQALSQTDVNSFNNFDSNKLFAYIQHINITMANTTQILDRAEVPDLYRIAKANGCEDSYWSWAAYNAMMPKGVGLLTGGTDKGLGAYTYRNMYYGAGSVLRLKPGVDLVVPDQPLIPGANANNMVFQCELTAYVPPHSEKLNEYSLWLLFEYVGVAAISPGQCEITMNPLGSGEVMAVSPVMSATSEKTEGELGGGSGFWDRAKRGAEIAAHIANEGILSRILRNIPGMQRAAAYLEKHGYGETAPPAKRGRSGGAVIGKGLNEWI